MLSRLMNVIQSVRPAKTDVTERWRCVAPAAQAAQYLPPVLESPPRPHYVNTRWHRSRFGGFRCDPCALLTPVLAVLAPFGWPWREVREFAGEAPE